MTINLEYLDNLNNKRREILIEQIKNTHDVESLKKIPKSEDLLYYCAQKRLLELYNKPYKEAEFVVVGNRQNKFIKLFVFEGNSEDIRAKKIKDFLKCTFDVVFDDNHKEPLKLIIPYLQKRQPKGIFFEIIKPYEGLEADLFKIGSVDEFLNDCVKACFSFDSAKVVLGYILERNADFYALGFSEDEIKSNVKNIMQSDKSFEGIYSLIIGSSLKDFVKKDLIHLFKLKFSSITYFPA